MSQLYYSMSQQHVKSTNSNTTSDPERANAPISTSSSLVSRCLAPPSSPLPIPDPQSSKTDIDEVDAEYCKLFIYKVVISICINVLLLSCFYRFPHTPTPHPPPPLIALSKKRKRRSPVKLNDIRILDATHELLMADSEWYNTLFDKSCGSVHVSSDEYRPEMVKAYVAYFEDMKVFDKFRYSDTKRFFDFIDFLDKISSKSLGDVMEFMVVDEIRVGNSDLFRQLLNYQEEQAIGTEISVYEKLMLDHFESIRIFSRRSRLIPISYSFKNELYILLKIKLFGYTVLKSVNATWFVVDLKNQASIVRMEPRTILEHTADKLDRYLNCRVENANFPTAHDDHAFNFQKVEMFYKLDVTAEAVVTEAVVTEAVVTDGVEAEENSESDEESLSEDDFDPTRADGGGTSYYVGAAVFNKVMGLMKHGRGCMCKYPDDTRYLEEENANGIYIHNEHYCEGDCYQPCKFCHCERNVGEDNVGEDSADSDSDFDYNKCALHVCKDEICTNLDEDTVKVLYCNPCARNVKAMEIDYFMPYLQRLFDELTGRSFIGDWTELCVFFDMINPYESAYVRRIETYEDYVSLLIPTDQVIRKRDETLQGKISAYLKAHKY